MSVLETPRLRLRPLRRDDAALYVHLYTDPDVMQRILPPLSKEAATRAFEQALGQNASIHPGHRYWVIEHKRTGEAMGFAALLRAGKRAELGVMLCPAWWRQGISSEAFAPLIDHAFAGMGLDGITAQRPDDDHARIIDRLLGRFGFDRTSGAGPAMARWVLPRERWQKVSEHVDM